MARFALPFDKVHGLQAKVNFSVSLISTEAFHLILPQRSGKKAGSGMVRLYFLEFWLFVTADVPCIEATRVKTAAGRRIDGTRNISRQ
jgi:hypothetical protein